MDYKKLKKMEEEVRIGGKGSMRRKHKRIPSAEDGSDPDNDKLFPRLESPLYLNCHTASEQQKP
ncbi:uncharacterized protein Dsimw501_GD26900, isoform C [Drosophila simulans]|uniref:Uncharacterized protein, isoform C n=1 Tax=Drosophila simulans TaxID=7240 RepID=A0A0J9RW10_DROSI|nr:uncharacterized protein Dsimw501_GD26900, isoform C [Drosophila simulans]